MLKFQKSTMIGLYATMELARSGDELVTTNQLAERFHVSVHHLSKVLQQLSRAGLVATTRGAAGGHTLARDAKNITLYDVVALFEGGEAEAAACLLAEPGTDPKGGPHCLLHPVIIELDEQVRFTLQSISLKTLVRGARPAP